MTGPVSDLKHAVNLALAAAFTSGVMWERDKTGFQEVPNDVQREALRKYGAAANWVNSEDWRDLVKYLVTWTPECIPESFNKDNYYYRDGDEQGPFFTEGYLYTLLGKEDARTLLYTFARLLEAMDINLYMLQHEALKDA